MIFTYAIRVVFCVVFVASLLLPSIGSIFPRELLPKGSGFEFLYGLGIAALTLFVPVLICGIGVMLVETKRLAARISGAAIAAVGCGYMFRFALAWVGFLSPFTGI